MVQISPRAGLELGNARSAGAPASMLSTKKSDEACRIAKVSTCTERNN